MAVATRHTHRHLAALAAILALLAAIGVHPASATTTDVVTVQGLTYAERDTGPLLLDAYLPATWNPGRPAVVIVHGGGWLGGRRENHVSTGEALARRGMVAVSIDYRQAAGTSMFDQVDDVRDAIRFVRRRAASVGVDPARIAVMGDSAGGHLATLAGMAGRGAWDVDARVAAVVTYSGVYDLPRLGDDLGPTGALWVLDNATTMLDCSLLGVVDPACRGAWWTASPVNLVDPTDPPVFLVHGQDEFVPVAQAERFLDRLTADGVRHTGRIVDSTEHGRGLMPGSWDATLYFLSRTL